MITLNTNAYRLDSGTYLPSGAAAVVTHAVHDHPALPALGRFVLEGVARCLRHQPQTQRCAVDCYDRIRPRLRPPTISIGRLLSISWSSLSGINVRQSSSFTHGLIVIIRLWEDVNCPRYFYLYRLQPSVPGMSEARDRQKSRPAFCP